MICSKPFNGSHGCGQCLSCRINLRRLWTHRLLLEKKCHSECSFVTLTYDEMPPGASLNPKDTQDWLKRLRKHKQVRYYLVGEYGDRSQRPHYHVALFGHGGCALGYTNDFERRKCSCKNCTLIRSTWGLGLTDCAFLTAESAQYLGGYVTKKMTRKNNDLQKEYLGDRYPEFSRMSRKPGIGALYVPVISEFLCSDSGADLLSRTDDVPSTLRHGSRELPLGRYLQQQIRKYYGFSEVGKPEAALRRLLSEKREKKISEMSSMWEEAKKKKINHIDSIERGVKKQKLLNKEAKYKLFNKKGSL